MIVGTIATEQQPQRDFAGKPAGALGSYVSETEQLDPLLRKTQRGEIKALRGRVRDGS